MRVEKGLPAFLNILGGVPGSFQSYLTLLSNERQRSLFNSLLVGVMVMTSTLPALAEWTVEERGLLFYTDDIGIFSATRRLSRDGDPTQPALDTLLTDKGSDVVLEPLLDLSNSYRNGFGALRIDVQGQGFIYTDNSRFNHGTMRLQATQSFSPETRIRLRYYYAPNLFLGDNVDRQPGMQGLVEESVTSHIWSARLERNLTQKFELRLLGRFGLRRYNDEFAQRDLNFWTIGPHLEWRLLPRVKLGLSYHYERGLAEGRSQPQLRDDVSYVNNYGSADLDIELAERLSLQMAVHYERNDWTSGIEGDLRNGAHEDIFQGEAVFTYRMTGRVRLYAGVQRSSRKQSFEEEIVKNTNVGIGLSGLF